MDERLTVVERTFRGNTGLFRAGLARVEEVDGAWLRRAGAANHLAFLAVHLAGARYFIVRFLGGPAVDPLEKYHRKARRIEDIATFPDVAEVLAAWDGVEQPLIDALAGAASEWLDEDSGVPFPTPGPTRLDALTFLAQHECYHLGQIGLLRRVEGLPAAEWPRG